MERTIAVGATNMTYNLLLLYQLSYLAIFTAYHGQSLQWKSNWVEFHIHRKKVYWEFVLIRWTIDGLIAGGGFEPPFSMVWTLWDSVSLSCLNPDSRVSKVIYRVMRSTRLFYAVPAPRSCFEYYYAFWLYVSWKLPCHQCALVMAYWN